MAVKIRLKRMGKKKRPTYRVVVADARAPRDGRIIELIGRYDPHPDPSIVQIDNERARYWLDNGAQPTDRVQKLLEISGAVKRPKVSRAGIYLLEDDDEPPAPAAAPAPEEAPSDEAPPEEAVPDEAPPEEAVTEEAAAAGEGAEEVKTEAVLEAPQAAAPGEDAAAGDDAAPSNDAAASEAAAPEGEKIRAGAEEQPGEITNEKTEGGQV